MLDQEELRRRIRAARILAGVSQVEMNAGGEERGLRKHALGAVERGDAPVQHVHLAMLCEILDVPMSWFTEPRQVIVAQRAADYLEAFQQLLALLTEPEVAAAMTQRPAGEGRARDLTDLAHEPEDLGRSAQAHGRTPTRRQAQRK